MGVSTEVVSMLMRGGENHLVHGDNYDFILTIVYITPDEVYLKGLMMRYGITFTTTHYRQINNHLKSLGVSSAKWERKTSNARNVEVVVR
jgi:hypothetical protein